MPILGNTASQSGKAPGSPTITSVTAGDGSVSVAFSAPAYTGKGSVTYTATSSPGGYINTGSSSPIVVSGLSNGTSYTFTVVASTSYGISGQTSSASSPAVPVAPAHTGATWTSFSLPRSQDWCAIRSNGTRFVALASSSIYGATSTDGINWTEITLPAGLVNANVAWNGTIWLALSYYGANTSNGSGVATSTDGITWTARTKPDNYNATHALAAKGSTFANIGTNQGRGFVTTDGINYTTTSPAGKGWWGMGSNQTAFVATTYYGDATFGYSTDGVSWSYPNSGSYDNFDIAWNGSVFCSPAYNSNKVEISSDGLNWSTATLPSTNTWNGIGSAGSNFVTIATSSSAVATSPDGSTWTARTLPSTGNVQDTSISSLNGVFVAVSYGSSTAYRSTS